MSKVLIISQKTDPHIELVAKYLDEEPIIYDPFENPLDQNITYMTDGVTTAIEYKGIPFKSVKSVWFRKPKYHTKEEFKKIVGVNSRYLEFSHGSYTALTRGIYDLLNDRLWISRLSAIKSGQNKFLQCEMASKLGLKIPKMIATNSKEQALSFISSCNNKVVMKAMFNIPFFDELDSKYFFYTLPINETVLKELDRLYFCPFIFQEMIENKTDLRVTVVGNDVFACKIMYKHTDDPNTIDWRKYNFKKDALSYKAVDLPKRIENACRKITSDLGLKFGAIDLLYDGKDYWFLEINPNGQWGFLKDEVNDKIAQSLALLLN